MSDLLFEIFSEEIPARMQVQAAKDLERLVVGALSDRGLLFEGNKAFSGPRRLTLAITGLPAKQPDVSEEKKGPRINAPAKAIEGFLRSAGVTLEECEKRDDGKGEFYVAVINRQGRPTIEVLAELLPEAMAKLPWPKSMRWGTAGTTRWVRPLHSILATLDGEVIPFSFANVATGDTTRGHRFLSSGSITAKRFEDYEAALKKAHVILDAEERKARIYDELKQAAFVHGLELIEDEGLLNEVSGLAEWPVVLIGKIQDEFMDVPAEILQTSMRTHQKYFSLRDPKTQKMANRFAVVSNMVATDGGKEIIAGNERVLRARLSDAKFFWDQDRKTKLEARVDALKDIVFHAKLGTQYDRVESVSIATRFIAEVFGLDAELAAKAAWLSKADLTTGVVGEFPELQGVMGGYYANEDQLPSQIGSAIAEHYLPLGPNSELPKTPLGQCLALADKIVSIVALFYAGEIPTGSSDPFALRRAALGVIRIVLAGGHRLKFRHIIVPLFALESVTKSVHADRSFAKELSSLAKRSPSLSENEINRLVEQAKSASSDQTTDEWIKGAAEFPKLIMSFIADRLKVALREKGTRHDLIDAVFSLGSEDDLVRLVARVEALQSFLKTDDGKNLLAGYKRAANILKAEEKKDGKRYSGEPDAVLLVSQEERKLAALFSDAYPNVVEDIQREDFQDAMFWMSRLREPVDNFFNGVKVNDDDPKVRENRLKLLARFRDTLHLVADFSKIEG